MHGKTLKIQFLSDSEALFNINICNGSTTEEGLMIYVKAATETYSEGIIDGIILLRRKVNLPHAMKKWLFFLSLLNH